MTQLKVERVAVARYFESLGQVITNAQKLEQTTQQATDVTIEQSTDETVDRSSPQQ